MKEIELEIGKFGARLKGDTARQVEAVKRGMREAAFVAEVMVAAKTPVDEGNTRAAWRTLITPQGADVVNDSPVALYLEEGTRPHRPPLLPILRWLARREGVSSTLATLEDAPKELIARAIGIADSIEENGTKAHRMLGSSIPDIERVAKQRVERALAKETQG